MKRRLFSEEQIIGVLKEAEEGLKLTDLWHKYSFSDVGSYAWRAELGGMEVSNARRRNWNPRTPA